jgi:hypothetical protein
MMTTQVTYTLGDGQEVTREEIVQAVKEGRAVLCWSHGNWVNTASLNIYEDADTASMESERDTRGQCYSMADEVWCELAAEQDALKAARGLLKVS